MELGILEGFKSQPIMAAGVAASFAVLKPGGSMVSTVSKADRTTAAIHRVSARFFLVDVTSERLNRIATMIENGAFAPSIGTVLRLAEARVVHEMLDGIRSRPRGKIVLRVAD